MNRATFPKAQVSTSLVKALDLHLAKAKGEAALASWRDSIGMRAEDLRDETRLLPLSTLLVGLAGFCERAGLEALDPAAKELLARENLGAVGKILRASATPEEALANLHLLEGDEGARHGKWSIRNLGGGHVIATLELDDQARAAEKDGLLGRYRSAVIAAVLALYGIDSASVQLAGDAVYEVRWKTGPRGVTHVLPLLFGGGFALVASMSAGEMRLPTTIIAGCVGFFVGVLPWHRDALRVRVQGERAKVIRLRALERGLELSERRSNAEAGDLEGAVVAGRYRIEKRMGSGASGVIYEAIRIDDGVRVALKLLRAAAAHDAVAADRLRREAEALGLAWHPNVVELLDHGQLADGTSYLVMERLEGESLGARIRRDGKLAPEALLPILEEVLEALSAVHAAGVVHRDVTPQNVFLVPDEASPRGERVKLLDFGIARVEWEEMRITGTGSPLGTPGYMAPEQERGDKVDARADLYAAGAIAFEALTGAPPAKPGEAGGAGPDRMHDARDSGVQRASQKMPTSFAQLLERALAQDPDGRFADARAMLAAVRGAGEGLAKLA